MSGKMKIIVDVDCGVDDAWGLFLLLSKKEKFDILGITCANGNTAIDHVCRNTCYLLQTAERTEIPVFRGAAKPLLQIDNILPPDFQHYFGVNGFGDIKLPEIPLPEIKKENAVVAMNRIVQENKGEVTIVCFAPLTNIALTIRTYPDFVNNVKEIFIMGGNYTAVGNTTMCAEFNFHTDPEAAHVVFTSFEGKNLTLLPWETCYNLRITYNWRKNELGKSENKVLKLLNKIEAPCWDRANRLNITFWTMCDLLCAAVIADPTIAVKYMNAYAIPEISGHHTRGQLVIDHLLLKKPNVNIIQTVDQSKFQQILTSIV